MSILVVVADSSHARILRAESTNGSLSEVADLVNPSSRQAETDLISDKRGSGKDHGSSGLHSMGHEKESHKRQKQEFAQKLCDEVDALMKNTNIQKLYLVAPPEFTGITRKVMSKQAAKLLVAEIEKDLVKHSLADIRRHLPKHL